MQFKDKHDNQLKQNSYKLRKHKSAVGGRGEGGRDGVKRRRQSAAVFTKEVDLKVNFGKLRRGSREETAGAKHPRHWDQTKKR